MNRAVGIDFGDARVGVAVSDELGMLAHPLETITVRETDPVKRVMEIVREKQAGVVVIGLPKNMDGTTGSAAEKARAFADKLRAGGIEVRMWDERLSTVAAQRNLHEAGRNAKTSRAVIDQAAAQIILQGWLDAQSMAGPGL
ncbi:MAG: putative Holliday junction resolvase [Verrucomicrobiota bacterium]|jgi:putative Holliday junction resolvase